MIHLFICLYIKFYRCILKIRGNCEFLNTPPLNNLESPTRESVSSHRHLYFTALPKRVRAIVTLEKILYMILSSQLTHFGYRNISNGIGTAFVKLCYLKCWISRKLNWLNNLWKSSKLYENFRIYYFDPTSMLQYSLTLFS